MALDLRGEAAKYYDWQSFPYDDFPFYIQRLPGPEATVLELGCGTGRVLVPLSRHCAYIHGLDASEAMLAQCREKLVAANVPASKASVHVADITNFDLGRTFNLIIAPFRVLQNLESDEQVDGLFRSIGRHLAADGICILNVFNPNADPETIVRRRSRTEEVLDWEREVEGDRFTASESNHKAPLKSGNRFIIYPRLIFRHYRNDSLLEQSTLDIAMRIYYPEEFKRLITGHGFKLVEVWGGYAGEVYGQGSELVLAFSQ